jgi:two-component system LytT family response regulator
MKRIQLSKVFFKTPVYIILILLIALSLFELFNWILNYENKLSTVIRFGGVLAYLFILLRGGIAPELVTTVIIVALIDFYHILLKINTVGRSWRAIIRYELIFLPVILLAFFFFNPITQTIRFALVEFPNYDFSLFLNSYILGTYSWRLYFLYLIPVTIIGYSVINISLFIDLLRNQEKLQLE